jgi:GAF domain-containing protein
MDDFEGVDEAIVGLGEFFVRDASVTDTLGQVAERTKRAVAGAAHVGVTMVVDGELGTFVYTHPDVARIDHDQYETGAGPCVDAYRSGIPVTISSTAVEVRYPRFAHVAAAYGVRSALSLPLTIHDRSVGALNLYATAEAAFDERDLAVADRFANQAAFVLANSQAYWDARHLSENLQAAMESRATIEQAKGILIASIGCTPEEAIRRLVDQSQYENVKLRDLAARLVANAQGHPHAPDP